MRGQRRIGGSSTPTETQALREKQKLIKEKFKGWIFSDPTGRSASSGITTTRTTICGQAVRRLAPGLSGDEQGDHAQAAPGRRGVALHDGRKYAAGTQCWCR